MINEKIQNTIDLIHYLFHNDAWVDFEIIYHPYIRLIAGEEVSDYRYYDVEITFDDIIFISTLLDWTCDPEVNLKFLRVLPENNELYKKNNVKPGYYIFEFITDKHFVPSFTKSYIVAKGINYKINNNGRFSLEGNLYSSLKLKKIIDHTKYNTEYELNSEGRLSSYYNMLLADKIHKIRENVDAINSFFKNYDKLEFKIINKGSIEVIAGSDLSVKYDIKIFFDEIYFMSTPFEWSSTPAYKFNIIKILQDESEINGKFYLEKGWFLFEFSSDAFPDGKNYITASSISYEINKAILA